MNQVSVDEVRARQLDTSRRIGFLLLCGLTLMLCVVLVRVAQLQLQPSKNLTEHLGDRVSYREAKARRGDVVDSKGRILAATRPGYRLFVDPVEFGEPKGDSIHEIASITGVDESEVGTRIVEAAIRNKNSKAAKKPLERFLVIGGMLTDAQVELAQRTRIRGVHLERRSVREFVGPATLAPIVGKVGFEESGLTGIERTFEQKLEPTPGTLKYVRDARGSAMWVEADGYKPGRPGERIRLTLDAAIQQIAYDELVRGVEEANAEGGRLIMVDPATGDILAMVDHVRDVPDLQTFDAKRAKELISAGQRLPRYRTIRPDKFRDVEPSLARNRCVEDVYEPGSTLKAFVWSSILERAATRPNEVFDVHDGVWTTDFGRLIRDVTPKSELTWDEVLLFSSNIGMAQGAMRIGGRELRSDLRRFGFGQKTGIALAGESPGLVTSEKSWTHWTQTSVAQGYEIAVTPLQMARAFCVFARQGEFAGTLPTLRLVHEDEPDDVVVRALPADIALQARHAMSRIGEGMEQRARRADADEPAVTYGVFGKSGTAEVVRPGGGGYIKFQHNSSFIAGAPVDEPRIVVLVVIDDPGPELVAQRRHFGSATAGPVVRRVVRRTLEYLGAAMPEPTDLESVASR